MHGWLIASVAHLFLAPTISPVEHAIRGFTFSTQDCVITMKVIFLEPYLGTRLSFYAGSKELCLSVERGTDGCSEKFVGAVALVQFAVRDKHGRRVRAGEIRERVVLIGKSAEAPDRAVFTKTVGLVDGTATDIQLYGYDESELPGRERVQAREQAKSLWMHFRQELYWNQHAEPFALIEWRHSIDEIRLLRIGSDQPRVR